MYKKFEQLAQQKGVSAYKISKATGVSQSIFSNWKKGKYIPSAKNLQKIADYLGVPMEELISDQPKDYQKVVTGNKWTPKKKMTITVNKSKLLEVMDKLDDTDILRLLERADTMLDSEKYSSKKESSDVSEIS